MSTAFSRSMISLQADGFRRSTLGLFLVATLLGIWIVWLLFAQVVVYETTDAARLEVNRAAHAIEAPVAGRVVATRLVLGQQVQAGDVLVELDAETQRLQLEQERTRLAGLTAQVETLRGQSATEEQALNQARQAASVALDEARAQFQEADAVARFAEEEAERTRRLHESSLVSEVDLLRTKSQAQRHRAAADALRLAISRLDQEHQTQASDREAQLKQLKGGMTQLEGEMATAAATIARLEYEIDKRRIRAPVAGRLGEISPELQVGAFVNEGNKLGAIVPPGEVKAVAEFPPPQALGRIRSGQPARLRLQGFPWAQYGSIAATVTNVADETRDGRVRVEFAIHPDAGSLIPLQHGLPGTVEVQVDRASPAALVLRATGKLLASPGS